MALLTYTTYTITAQVLCLFEVFNFFCSKVIAAFRHYHGYITSQTIRHELPDPFTNIMTHTITNIVAWRAEKARVRANCRKAMSLLIKIVDWAISCITSLVNVRISIERKIC